MARRGDAIPGRRTAAVLALAAIGATAAACRGEGPVGPPSGPATYRARTCYRCHGSDRSGTEIGPPLRSLASHWDEGSLVRYISDPAPFPERDPRIRDLVRQYHGKLMKGFPMPPEEARTLARWLLSDPDPHPAGEER